MHATRVTHTKPTSINRPRRLNLIVLVLALSLAGGILVGVAGPPHVPDGLGEPNDILRWLTGSRLPVGPLVTVLVDAAWSLWLWLLGSLGLEILLVAIDFLAGSVRWARSLHHVVDRLRPPLVRRAVAAAVAVQLLSRSVTAAEAAPPPTQPAIGVAADNRSAVKASSAAARDVTAPARATPERPNYLVRDGDTLWSIAQRAYGSGSAYRRIVDANVGRMMTTGQPFTARGVIQPGWQLVVPDLPRVVEIVDGRPWYTVQAGDTLSSIALAGCGDELRWFEIFQLNRGALTPDGGRTLTDADLIWPGLRLELPADDSLLEAAPRPTASDAEAETDLTETDLVAAASLPADLRTEPLETAPEAVPPVASAVNEILTPGAANELTDTLPPLLRTAHAQDPIVLEPLDLAVVTADDLAPATDDGTVPTAPAASDVALIALAAGTTGVIAGGAAIVALRRRRRLRRLHHLPESEVVVAGGFATADLTAHVRRPGSDVTVDPLTAIVAHLQRILDEDHLAEAKIVAVRHGRSATTLTIAASLSNQALVSDLTPLMATELGMEVETSVSDDGDLLLRVTRLSRTRPLPPDSFAGKSGPCLLPLGVLYDRQTLAATWHALGNVLIASLPGHGADTILTSLVATLTARHAPSDLRLWVIGRARALPAPMRDLPHVELWIETDDSATLSAIADRVRAELDRRSARPSADEVVIIIAELSELGEAGPSLALLASRAATLGVRFIAASALPQRIVDNPLLSAFGTRMVLRMQDDDTSIALLGVADAAYLGGGGRLLVRIDNRAPVELYGYQVTPDHLARLVRVMRSAFAGQSPPPSSSTLPVKSPLPVTAQAIVSVEARDTIAADESTIEDSGDRRGQAPATAPAAESSDGPPLQVLCLGGPRVLCGGQQVWPTRSSGEAKPWELLLFLACQPPEGVSSQDVVDALWPEDDSDNASQRFRQLRYRLRQALAAAPAAPDHDGISLIRGTLQLDSTVVYSDAAEFLDLVRLSRAQVGESTRPLLERARALYAGDLLEGPDARRYAWLDERDNSGVTLREHFRKNYVTVSVRLADMYAATTATAARAIDVYRELTELDPGDERLWRALFRIHADRHDRPALMREERRLRELLRELADDDDGIADGLAEPSHDLRDEYQRLLDGLRHAERATVAI